MPSIKRRRGLGPPTILAHWIVATEGTVARLHCPLNNDSTWYAEIERQLDNYARRMLRAAGLREPN